MSISVVVMSISAVLIAYTSTPLQVKAKKKPNSPAGKLFQWFDKYLFDAVGTEPKKEMVESTVCKTFHSTKDPTNQRFIINGKPLLDKSEAVRVIQSDMVEIILSNFYRKKLAFRFLTVSISISVLLIATSIFSALSKSFILMTLLIIMAFIILFMSIDVIVQTGVLTHARIIITINRDSILVEGGRHFNAYYMKDDFRFYLIQNKIYIGLGLKNYKYNYTIFRYPSSFQKQLFLLSELSQLTTRLNSIIDKRILIN